MARTTRTTPTARPTDSIFSRLRGRTQPAATTSTTKSSTNPLTGKTTTTTTKTTKTHGHGAGHHTGTATTGMTGMPVQHHRRKPTVGDKVSGALMKVKGSLTGKSGVKAAGTRRMHGTDGKGSHRVY